MVCQTVSWPTLRCIFLCTIDAGSGPRKDQMAVKKVFKTGSVYESKFFENDITAANKASEIIKAFNDFNESRLWHGSDSVTEVLRGNLS